MTGKTVGERLKELRGYRTQYHVATEMGITPCAYANYEQNIRRPRDSVKKKIAEYYGVSIEELFF